MVMRARKLNRVNVKERISMFDKRLFSLAPGVGRLVAAKVLCQWIGLLSNVVFVVTMVLMLSPALAMVESAFDPMFSMGDSGLISRLFVGFGYGGFSAETYVGCVLAIVVCAVLRFLMMRAAAYFGAEAAERVKLALREQLFNKMRNISVLPTWCNLPVKASNKSKASSNYFCRNCFMRFSRR